jgi:hypothetical protein
MGTQPSENCPLDLFLPFSAKTKTVGINQFVNRFRQLRQDTNDTKKRQLSDNYNWYYVVFSPLLLPYRLLNPVQINQNEKSDSGLGVYWGTDRATKSTRVPWRRGTDIINYFHFLQHLYCLCVHQTVLKFPSPARANVKRSFICNWRHFAYKKCIILFWDKNIIPTNKRE